MHVDDQISTVFQLVNERKNTHFVTEKYVLLTVKDDQLSGRIKDSMTKELIERFGGYNAFGVDERLIDPKTHVRNLKTNIIEIRPKIFTDKPTEKQLDMTFETKMKVMNTSVFKQISHVKSNNFGMIDTSAGLNKNKSMSVMPTNKLNAQGDQDDPLLQHNKSTSDVPKTYKQEGDFLYGYVSGNQLEEFAVIKYNRKNKAQERLLCIDGFNIYNKERTKND